MQGRTSRIIKAISVLLLITMLTTLIPVTTLAYTEKTGYINGTQVRMRSGPGTNYSVSGVFSQNQSVTVIGEDRDSSNNLWYNVKSSIGTGYVFAEYVTVTGEVQQNPQVKEYDTPYSARITENSVNFRSKATTSSSSYGQLNKDSQVTVIGEDSTSGKLWYHLKAVIGGQEKVGYVFGEYVERIAEYTYEGDFESYLNSQGFPESYKDSLRNLHALYPKWVFIADKLAVTFENTVNAENKAKISLIQTSNDALKSNEEDAFDPATGTYIVYDSGGWVTASRDIVKYYLDPRNFLNTTGIFQFFSQSYDASLVNKTALQGILNGTFMAGDFPEDSFDTYADVLMYAGQVSGVSPYALAAQILIEQGSNGAGGQISGNVENYNGIYNYYSIGAYAHDGRNAVQNGLAYAKTAGSYDRPWDTRLKAIVGGAKWYAAAYVSAGQNTYYYKKFNVIKEPYYQHQYMTNIMAASLEAEKFRQGFSQSLDNELIFHIPVYRDMPNEISAYPTAKGSNNFYLQSLSVDGYQLTPTFSVHKYEYDIIVENNVSTVNINASAYDSRAQVSGTGQKTLDYGENSFKVTVTAECGDKKEYTLNIFRSGNAPNINEPSVVSSYSIGEEYVKGVSEETDVNLFLSRFTVTNGTVGVVSNGTRKTSGYVASGDLLVIYNNEGVAFKQRTVSIAGDINGDGRISIIDLSIVQKNILGLNELTVQKTKYADTNGDGKISIIDLSKIQRHILGIQKISQ